MNADTKSSKVESNSTGKNENAEGAFSHSNEPHVPHAEQTSAGNFLRNDKSLVMRSARSDRFTDKFKEGIVQRILQGTTTISDVREQHYLTEQDVIAWMKQSYDRKQKRIDDLMQQLRDSETKDRDRIIKIETQPNRVTIKGDVIDGRSHTK